MPVCYSCTGPALYFLSLEEFTNQPTFTEACRNITVFDEDRVALNSMHFGNPASAGASCRDSDIVTSDLNGRVSSAAERSPDDSVSFFTSTAALCRWDSS
jgi:hypothetical protein